MTRNQLINKVVSEKQYKAICNKLNSSYGDDLFQEMCELILTIDEQKLEDIINFDFWFYRVASRMNSDTGTFGRLNKNNELPIYNITHGSPLADSNDTSDTELKLTEALMLNLPEFDNRVILLYKELGNMKAVEKATGISYSALRKVKERIKQLR